MYLGFNGTNWFDAQSPMDVAWLVQAAPLQGFTLRFRADKSEDLEGELNKVIALKEAFGEAGKEFNIIFTANIDVPAEEMFNAIAYLRNNSINIITVEADNEYYASSQANFDFEVYKAKFKPLRDMLAEQLPELTFSIFIAPRPAGSGIAGGRKDHQLFNDAVKTYMSTEAKPGDGVSIHIYYGNREVPIMSTKFTKVVLEENDYYPDLDNYYRELANGAIASHHLDFTLDYLSNNFNSYPIYVTEFGYNGAGDIKNTIGYAMGIFDFWVRANNKFTALLEHNGIAPTNTGCITPKTQYDVASEEVVNLRRTSFFTFELISEFFSLSYAPVSLDTCVIPGTLNLDFSSTFNLSETTIPSHTATAYEYTLANNRIDCVYYTNSTDAAKVYIYHMPEGKQLVEGKVVYLSGNTMYSSSGSAPFMLKGSTPSYEVDAITEEVCFYDTGTGTLYVELPPNSFGYVYIEQENVPVPPPCNKPWYCWFLPNARKCKC